MHSSPMDRAASVSLLHEWRQQNSLPHTLFVDMMARLRSVEVWRRWGGFCFLVLGAILLLCGIVFFFAWNWEGMARWQRLSLTGVAILVPALASRQLGPGTLPGRLSLLCASAMIGVFLAVHGQEYQTGADTHQLFFRWALLALPWVLGGCFEALWVLWLLILSTGLTLYWTTVLEPAGWRWPSLFIGLSGLHACALVVKELLARRGVRWAGSRWARLWLLTLALGPSAFVAAIFVIAVDKNSTASLATGAGIWLVLSTLAFVVYRYRLRDTAGMGLTVALVGAVVATCVVRWLWEIMTDDRNDALLVGIFFFNTAATGAVVAGWVWLLRKLALKMAEEDADHPAAARAEPLPAPPALPARSADAALTWRQILPEGKQAELENQISALATQPREPVWLKAVSAIGGWIAAWMFLPMLFFVLGAVWDDSSGTAMIISGLLVIGASVALSRTRPAATFLQQLLLAAALGGWGITNLGWMAATDDFHFGAFVALQCVLAASSYPLMRNGAYRFLVVAWCLGCVTAWQIALAADHQDQFTPLIIALAVLTAGLWAWRSRPAWSNPAAHAVAFSLAGVVLFFTLARHLGWERLSGTPRLCATAIGLCLVVVIAVLNRGIQSLRSPWIAGLALIIAPLAWFGEMGVLTAMLLMTVAFAWGDKLLSVFAWAFLGGFLFLFYYDMAIPLSWKSAIIGGSGILFLLVRAVLLKYHPHPAHP